MAKRGELTQEVNDKTKELIGRKITRIELRLFPYINYVMTNERKIDPNKINQEEREVLQKWKKEGFIAGGMTGLAITKEFWDLISEVLFIAYVGFDN